MNSGIERAALMVSEEKHHQDSRKLSHHESKIHFIFSVFYHFRQTEKVSKKNSPHRVSLSLICIQMAFYDPSEKVLCSLSLLPSAKHRQSIKTYFNGESCASKHRENSLLIFIFFMISIRCIKYSRMAKSQCYQQRRKRRGWFSHHFVRGKEDCIMFRIVCQGFDSISFYKYVLRCNEYICVSC